jgi:Ca2+-binding EF-hand superfamily protein
MEMNPSKTTIAAALFAATFAISPLKAADLESQFVQLDLDSDGRIAQSEWSGGFQTFENLDRDGDAVVSRIEFFNRGVRYQTREERFGELDKDRDGRLSAGEWKWGEETMALLDRDGDGSLTRQEFLATAATRMADTASKR